MSELEEGLSRRDFLIHYGAPAVGLMGAFIAGSLKLSDMHKDSIRSNAPRLRSIGQRVLREQAEASQTAQPLRLDAILANDQYMFTQVGRTMAAVYADIAAPDEVTILAVDKFATRKDRRGSYKLWDYLGVGDFEGRYAVVERQTVDGPGIDIVTVPMIRDITGMRQRGPKDATLFTYENMLEAAAVVDISDVQTRGFFRALDKNNYSDWAEELKRVFWFPKYEIAEAAPTRAMKDTQRTLITQLHDPQTGSGPLVRMAIDNNGYEPRLEYIITGKGSDRAVEILDAALNISTLRGMTLGSTDSFPFKPYVTPETIAMFKPPLQTVEIIKTAVDEHNIVNDNTVIPAQVGIINVSELNKYYFVRFPLTPRPQQ
jgi:hypothetical protein